MAIGTVTLAWHVVDPFTLAPGIGSVRVRVPLPLRATTDHLLIGSDLPSDWIPLDVTGSGSIVILDPHDPGVSPQGWSPQVEINSDVLTEKFVVVIPPGSANTTIHLDTKAPAEPVPPVVDYALVSLLADYVPKAGARITGPILWDGPPTDDDHLVTKAYADSLAGGGGSTPDATTLVKGKVRLAGDLAGTADAPTVPALAAKYVKPGPGIPPTDLTAAVQTSLGKADTAVQPGTLATVATTGSAADLTGVLPASALPDIAVTDYLGAAANQAAMLALVGQKGDWCTRTDLGTNWIITGSNPALIGSWTALTYPASPVVSVFGRTGTVVGTKVDVGLPNVDNTSDLNKPISTATQTALDTKQARSTLTTKGDLYVATGAGVVARLPVGADGQVPVADAAEASGIRWAAPAAGGGGALDRYPPEAAGYLEWSADPQDCSADFAHANGVLLMVRLRYRGVSGPVGELWFAVASAAGGPGAYSGVALYEDGVGAVNRLAQSADSGTSWTTQGVKSIPFTSPVSLVQGAYYRAALLWQGSSPGRITGTPAAVLDTQLNAGVLRSTYLAGQTTFPSTITVTSMNINSAVYFLTLK